MLTRDKLMKEMQTRGGNLPTLLGVYAALLLVMGLTAAAIL